MSGWPVDPGWRPTFRRSAPPISLLRTVYLFCVTAPFLFLSALSELELEGESRTSSGDMELNDEEIPLPPKGTIDASQAWFWTQEWQAGEREADEDIEAGRGELFMSGAEFLGALEKLKPAHKGKRA